MSSPRELGSLQRKVVEFLAENPGNHKQAIQQGIGHPPDQYGSVQKAVLALERMGYIESEEGLSKKKVKIKLHSCTIDGVFYVLAKTPPYGKVLSIVDAYKEKFPVLAFFRSIYDKMGQGIFSRIFEYLMRAMPPIEKGEKGAMNQAALLVIAAVEGLDRTARKKVLAVMLDHYPEVKQRMKYMKNLLDEVL